ncbi:hypothetical protein GEMRC1_000032 [Eukaryota sp. GEM-RC1]
MSNFNRGSYEAPKLGKRLRIPLPSALARKKPRKEYLYVSNSVIDIFMNTVKNDANPELEMGALLIGKSGSNVIDEIFIPRNQSRTSIIVDILDDSDEAVRLLEFVGDTKYVYGWIHTHPNMSNFFSSVDIESHMIYQQSVGKEIGFVGLVCSFNVSDFEVTTKAYMVNSLVDEADVDFV